MMDREQAKFILHAYRSDAADGQDPRFADALGAVRDDAELAEWFREHQALNASITRKLREGEPPPNLKARILAGITETPHPGTRAAGFRRYLRIAAAIILIPAAALIWVNQLGLVPAQTSTFAREMTDHMEDLFFLDLKTDDLGEIQTWLAQKHDVPDYNVPVELAKHPSLGCRVFDWRGHDVYLVCFAVESTEVHLFMIRTESLADPPDPAAGARFAADDTWRTALWRDGENTYFAATHGDEELLKRIVGRNDA